MNVLNHCSSGVIRASRISRISKGLWCWGGMGGAPAHIAFPSGWAEGCDEGALYTGEFLAFCTPFIAWFYGSSHFLFIGGSAMRQAWGGGISLDLAGEDYSLWVGLGGKSLRSGIVYLSLKILSFYLVCPTLCLFFYRIANIFPKTSLIIFC